MIPPSFRKLGGACLFALCALALAGCGRNGPLELPAATTPPANGTSSTTTGEQTSAATVATNPPPASPDAHSTAPPKIGPAPPPRPAGVTPVYKSFFLDPLVN